MKRKTILLLMTAALTLCGCTQSAQSTDSAAETSGVTAEELADTGQENTQDGTDTDLQTPVSDIDTNDQFTDRDQDSSWDEESAVTISFTDDGVTVSGDGAEVSGTTLTITKAGTYVLSGTCSDGQIVIDCGDEDKVQLVLDGLTLTNDDGPCILVKSADKVFVTLADGTENTLSDTGEAYAQEEDVEQNLDGVIFSLCTLTFNGSGTLRMNAGYDHAIVSKDDVKITDGTYEITAAGKGIAANDSIRISGGDLTITAEDDGLHTGNEDDDGKGYIYICGGRLTISSGDDGIHAATALYVTDGVIDVTKSYEGLEGDSIDITGGTIRVVSDDDGLNASTGSGQEMQGTMPQGGPGGGPGGGKAPEQAESETVSVTPTRMGGGGGQTEDDGSYIRISGGDICIDAEGDGIDSNGALYIDGGTIIADGPDGAGNGALDVGSEAVITGGTVIAGGSSDMAVTFSDSSTQYSVLVYLDDTVSAGTEVTLRDADGNEILTYTPAKDISSVVFSSSLLAEGTYTLRAGDETMTVEVSGISSTSGSSSSSFGGGPKSRG
ncbi:MAG: carbohydrate-binding domain-containing protein [Lachnospiraceae bacterium]|jgi:hypothetical protein